VKVMSFAGGKRSFKCHLPPRENLTVAASGRARGGASAEGGASAARSHFIAAKLVPLRGKCWRQTKDYWTYEVCFGHKVTQFRADSDLRFSLGQHQPDLDALLPGGGVREVYSGGTDNRTTEVRYVCGTAHGPGRSHTVVEERPLDYVWTVTGPQFCAWREEDGAKAIDADGTVFKVSAMLEELRGSCVNVTKGWWTYEYCYPFGITQFHLQGNSRKRDPEHSLGTLNGTGAETRPDRVAVSMVQLRPSISPRERRAPPSKHRTLQQRLGNGTVCHEVNRPRATTVSFQCPSNWQQRPATKIISISESSLCEYDVLIHTTLLCGHEKLLPSMPRGKETIQCVAEPAGGAAGAGGAAPGPEERDEL